MVEKLEWKELQILALDHLIWIIALVAYLVFVVIAPGVFGSVFSNLNYLLMIGSWLLIMALAESISLISGTFDLTIAAVAGMAGMFSVLIFHTGFLGMPPIFFLILPLAIGTLLGLINGILVGKLGINSFILTLATLIIFRSFRSTIHAAPVHDVPGPILFAGSGTFLGINASAIIAVVTVLCVWLFLNYTDTGIRIYQIGGDSKSAELLGVNVENTRVIVYMIAGALAGLAGLIYVGYNGSAPGTMLDGSIFWVFGIAVLGGVSLDGGKGEILNVLGAAIFWVTVQSGLNFIGIGSYSRNMLKGVILLSGIIMNAYSYRIKERLLHSSSSNNTE